MAEAGAARAACGCRCIRCKSAELGSHRIGPAADADGYYDMHHTCGSCNAHFDHLEGVVFDACDACGYGGTDGHAAADAAAAPAPAADAEGSGGRLQ